MNRPVQTILRSEIAKLKTPTTFAGVWLHSTNVKQKIVTRGWSPDLVKNTRYGAAIYLSRNKWSEDHADAFECVLDLSAAQTQSDFPNPWENGRDEKHFLWHLKDLKVVRGASAGPGTSSLNRKIAAHFIGKGIHAVAFVERGTEIVAVYDPICIRVIA
jgi:hypothetical protein